MGWAGGEPQARSDEAIRDNCPATQIRMTCKLLTTARIAKTEWYLERHLPREAGPTLWFLQSPEWPLVLQTSGWGQGWRLLPVPAPFHLLLGTQGPSAQGGGSADGDTCPSTPGHRGALDRSYLLKLLEASSGSPVHPGSGLGQMLADQ